MSNLRKLFRKADDAESVNKNLFEDGSVESGQYTVKAEIANHIAGELNMQVNYEPAPGHEGRDGHDGPDHDISFIGTFNLSELEGSYGPISDTDVHYLVEGLGYSDSPAFKDAVKQIFDEDILRSGQVTDFTYSVSNSSKTIKVEAKVEDISEGY